MAVNISGLKRNLKNVACSYSYAQVKVREATSNDPWGPSATMMSEVADLTYNVAAFKDVMQMIWKRLNDTGKNWRHVYKALVLLEHLLKTGCDKVIEDSKLNLFVVRALVDFQYLDDNRDHGINVREKAKAILLLLRDDETLKVERIKALKSKFTTTREIHHARKVLRQSQSAVDHPLSELEDDRPHTRGEEDLQVELALAMSKEETEAGGMSGSQSDNLSLANNFSHGSEDDKSSLHEYDDDDSKKLSSEDHALAENSSKSALLDLVDINFDFLGTSFPKTSFGNEPNYIDPPPPYSNKKSVSLDPLTLPSIQKGLDFIDADKEPVDDPWSPPIPARTSDISLNFTDRDIFGASNTDLFGSRKSSVVDCKPLTFSDDAFDPWKPIAKNESPPSPDPFSQGSQCILANFDNMRDELESAFSATECNRDEDALNDPFVVRLDPSIISPKTSSPLQSPSPPTPPQINNGARPKQGVGSLLNEHQSLVDLDNWAPFGKNPFEQKSINPFYPAKPSTPMNQLSNQNTSGLLLPTSEPDPSNPFF